MDPAAENQDSRHQAIRFWGGRAAALQKGRTLRQPRSDLHGKSRENVCKESACSRSGCKVARRVGSLQCTDATPEGSATLQGSKSGASGAKVPKGEKLQPGSK